MTNTITAKLIRANGTEEDVVLRYEDDGIALDELYRVIGCSTVEHLNLHDGRDMWLDEDGKAKRLPVNDKATNLLHLAGGVPWDVIVGDVLIDGDVRATDGETLIGGAL